MSAHPCSVTGCGQARLAGVHSRHAIEQGWGHKHRYVPEVKRRTPLAPHSEAMADYYAEVRIPAVIEAQGQPCEAQLEGVCIGDKRPKRDIHEIVSRSAAGSLPLAEELGTATLCRACHDWLTVHPREAREYGFRMTRKDVGL